MSVATVSNRAHDRRSISNKVVGLYRGAFKKHRVEVSDVEVAKRAKKLI